ncbi:MAG: polysaccharide deacetylase family protein [Spirochaetes bacterium]|nr:polysaccharide deacetylase family protein [Spirochaetota bacterium]MBX3723254.1 polysaccharide deacetylase family protein [Turneriella sp.]
MYSRFKAFIFLTALIFGVVGLIAFLQGRARADKPLSGPIAIKAAKPADIQATPSAPGDILQNWRADIGVPVLCYHQIVTEEKYRERPTPYAVTTTQFREQMEFLAQNNFYTILPDELLAYVRGQKALDFSNGRRPIVLTFDDGNNDFVDHAQKVLEKHNFKGVLFIYPTYIFAHKPRSLTWAQINAVRKAGHAIESHTMWHPMLSTMTDAEQKAQFVDSKKNLDEKGGANVKHLAYPFGIYNASSAKLLKEVGYESAYTTFHGGNQVGEDPYLLRRYLIVKGDSEKVFEQKTLARSLPLKLLNSEPGGIIEGPTALKLGLPRGLKRDGFKVRVFSTPREFEYTPETGEMTVQVVPSKKRLSVLEIVYKENGVEYRANALLNHKRGAATEEEPKKTKKKKRKKKKRTQED